MSSLQSSSACSTLFPLSRTKTVSPYVVHWGVGIWIYPLGCRWMPNRVFPQGICIIWIRLLIFFYALVVSSISIPPELPSIHFQTFRYSALSYWIPNPDIPFMFPKVPHLPLFFLMDTGSSPEWPLISGSGKTLWISWSIWQHIQYVVYGLHSLSDRAVWNLLQRLYEVEERFLVTVMPCMLFRYRFWYSVVFEWVLW